MNKNMKFLVAVLVMAIVGVSRAGGGAAGMVNSGAAAHQLSRPVTGRMTLLGGGGTGSGEAGSEDDGVVDGFGGDEYGPVPPYLDEEGYWVFGDNVTERQIKNWIKRRYDTSSRPVLDDQRAIVVRASLSLYHILDTNEKYQVLQSLIALRLRWTDEFWRWRSSTVKQVWLPTSYLWVPDIVFKNNAEENNPLAYKQVNSIIKSNGDILWMFPVLLKSQCSFHVDLFPFDSQLCRIIIISWTYSGRQIDLECNGTDENTIYYNPDNQEWFADTITVEKKVSKYACCDDAYPEIRFAIHLRRRSLFYVFNLVFPCVLFYGLSFLGFFLPVQSGDKVNLEITVLLSLIVFLMIVAETLPPTPESLPILGLLVCVTMVMVSIALMMAVIVTAIYHYDPQRQMIPRALFPLIRCFGSRDFIRYIDNIDGTVTVPSACRSRTQAHKLFCCSHCTGNASGSETHISLSTSASAQRLAEMSNPDETTVGCQCQSPIFAHKCANIDGTRRKTTKRLKDVQFGEAEETALYDVNPWHELSRWTDRLFFWLFFAASVYCFGYLGERIASGNETAQATFDHVNAMMDKH